MTSGTRTVNPGERYKGLSSTFQSPEEGRIVQRPKRSDKHGDKDEDNSPKNINNENEFSITFHFIDLLFEMCKEEKEISQMQIIQVFKILKRSNTGWFHLFFISYRYSCMSRFRG